jgi:iron complex transport system substrate-binding protein
MITLGGGTGGDIGRLSRLLSAHSRLLWGWAVLVKPHLVVLALLAAACTMPAPRAGGALSVVDDAGDTVRLAGPAHRIVSLSPTTTEVLFAIGAGRQVVGRTRWCDYPPEAALVPNVGDGLPPNIEAVLARHPDLVLAYRSAQNAEALRQLRSAGVAAVQLRMDHLADVPRLARLLGRVSGRSGAGDSVAAAFDRAVLRLARRDSAQGMQVRPRVLMLAWDQPPITIGGGSFQSEMLALAGGTNLFNDVTAPSAPVSIEAIAARDPDLILISDSGPPGLAARPEWAVVPAVREHRFLRFAMPAFSRPSPRAPTVIDELHRALAGTEQ